MKKVLYLSLITCSIFSIAVIVSGASAEGIVAGIEAFALFMGAIGDMLPTP